MFGGGLLAGEILDVVEDGNRLIRFSYEGIFEEILDQLGQMPLPPYITHQLEDKERYQTVYAKYNGSQRRQQRDFILRGSFWMISVPEGFRLRR